MLRRREGLALLVQGRRLRVAHRAARRDELAEPRGRLLDLCREEEAGHGDVEAVVGLEGLGLVELLEVVLRREDGQLRQLEGQAALADVPARLPPLLLLLRRAVAVAHRRRRLAGRREARHGRVSGGAKDGPRGDARDDGRRCRRRGLGSPALRERRRKAPRPHRAAVGIERDVRDFVRGLTAVRTRLLKGRWGPSARGCAAAQGRFPSARGCGCSRLRASNARSRARVASAQPKNLTGDGDSRPPRGFRLDRGVSAMWLRPRAGARPPRTFFSVAATVADSSLSPLRPTGSATVSFHTKQSRDAASVRLRSPARRLKTPSAPTMKEKSTRTPMEPSKWTPSAPRNAPSACGGGALSSVR